MQRQPTKKQLNVLRILDTLTRRHGAPPILAEIARTLGIRPPSVLQHLDALERKGLITRERGRPRSTRIVAPPEERKEYMDVPVVGIITAGRPILAFEQRMEKLRLHRQMLRGRRDVFALKVRGDSMKDAAILDGDFIIVNKQNHANDGDIVVALLEDDATVKRFQRKKDGVYLMPANDALAPIKVTEGDLAIQGKVIAVHRRVAA